MRSGHLVHATLRHEKSKNVPSFAAPEQQSTPTLENTLVSQHAMTVLTIIVWRIQAMELVIFPTVIALLVCRVLFFLFANVTSDSDIS
jgi:hypothetical protein